MTVLLPLCVPLTLAVRAWLAASLDRMTLGLWGSTGGPIAALGGGAALRARQTVSTKAPDAMNRRLAAVACQQSFVMLMMGVELILNGALLEIIGFWSRGLGGRPEGQPLAIIVMAVMSVEMAIGFALVVAVYRKRQADTIESLGTLKG